MRKTWRTIDGKVLRYADWLAEVRRLAAERNLPEPVRALATDPMLRDAWEKGERPGFFLDKLAGLYADVEVRSWAGIALIEPVSKAAREWVAENVPLESWQWQGGAFAVEGHGRLAAIVAGMRAGGRRRRVNPTNEDDMNNAKHTPGPWEVRKLSDGRFHVGPSDNKLFSVCYTSGFSRHEAEANAALIVRAVNAHDDLLAALRTAVRWLRRLEEEHPGCLNPDAIDRHLMPAIVRGESP